MCIYIICIEKKNLLTKTILNYNSYYQISLPSKFNIISNKLYEIDIVIDLTYRMDPRINFNLKNKLINLSNPAGTK